MLSGLLFLASQTAYADDSAQLKEASLQACATQASQVPEAQKEQMMKVCECTVENTDYAALVEKVAAGDASVQADAMAVAQKCAEENS